ncbi:uncharacterized protein V1516DRAFT_674531 [Lipomyces oligophaga]|uniref:uncharacterized protein n=1 Tax=Lipomyces oligophaga TaxID=45792 RepID=UPI0034CED331
MSETETKALSIREYNKPHDKPRAMELVGEAYAQRQSLANIYIFKHPYFIASLIPLAAFIFYRYDLLDDFGTIILLSAGLLMAMFSLFARITDSLKEITEGLMQDPFLDDADLAYVAVYGDKPIAVVSVKYIELNEYEAVLKTAQKQNSDILAGSTATLTTSKLSASSQTPSRVTRSSAKHPSRQAIITSWTVLKRYRRVGLGSDLIAKVVEAVKKDSIKNILIQCLSLEVAAIETLKKSGFQLVSHAKLNGALGRLGVETMTFSLQV